MPHFSQFNTTTHIICGDGLSQDFAHELSRCGISRLMLVSHAELAPLWTPIRKGLEAGGLTIAGTFSAVPSRAHVRVVKELAFEAKQCGAEGFVVVGGGTAIDTAKAANMIFTHGGDLVADYSGAQTLPGPLAPLAAIPTTAGTGSEVSQAAVIYDEAQNIKLSFVDHYLRPTLAVLDPVLTRDLPAALTAATGLDALTHAVESWVSVESNPFSDAWAAAALRRILKSLPDCVKDGHTMPARRDMIVAATMAGMAFDHAMVGVVHAVSHAIESLAHVHHGTANGIMVRSGMQYNMSVASGRYAELASVLGVGESADALLRVIGDLLHTLNQHCGFPLRLRDVGVTEAMLPDIAAHAIQDGTCVYNPREVVESEVLQMLKQVY